jgi:hypothetical protein
MPMNIGARPVRLEEDPATHKVIGYFESSDTHWATCPARDRFGRRRPKGGTRA